MFCREFVALRGFRIAGLAPTQQSALRQEFGASRSVNRAVYAASSEQGAIGCIDDAVHA
jgi:hypothetical protein